jgi:hypothetical protein
MNGRQSRIMARAGTVRRIDALFRAMQTDFLLREQFITDPAQILTEYLGGTRISPEQSVVTNQLIYAVFANKKLLRWFQDYAHRHIDDVPTTELFLADFCAAAVDHDGRAVVAALAAGCAAGTGVHGLSDDLLHYFINLHAAQVLSGEEVPEEADAEDEADHDSIAVVRHDEAAGSTLTAVTWTTYTTGTGTGTGTGVATRSPFTAVQLRSADDEVAIAPFIPRYAADTLNALARYAAQLQERGAFEFG